jgi:hypothetical protein
MENTVPLPTGSLKYYVNAKNWVSDLDFFTLENTFISRLLDDYFIRLSDSIDVEKLRIIGRKLIKLQEDKYYSDTILSEQFENLKLLTEQIIPENNANLACKQMEMEYLMTNLNSEYREVKKELFTLVDTVKL